MDEEAITAAAFANYPGIPEDILRRMVVDRQVTTMVNGVTNGIRDINEGKEFLHHRIKEYTMHGQGRNEQVRATWRCWWKTTYHVEWITKPNPPRRGDFTREEPFRKAMREYLNTYPELEPGDVIPKYHECKRAMGNCEVHGAAGPLGMYCHLCVEANVPRKRY